MSRGASRRVCARAESRAWEDLRSAGVGSKKFVGNTAEDQTIEGISKIVERHWLGITDEVVSGAFEEMDG